MAERSLLAGLRPVLIPSREEDSAQRIRFGDEQMVTVPGHGAAVHVGSEATYLAMAIRNGGAGLAVIHGWRTEPRTGASDQRPDLATFRRQQIDLYIPVAESAYWLGALRDPTEAAYGSVRRAAQADESIVVDLLYGDHEGGQRTITRFVISPWEGSDEGERATVLRYWNLDADDPRDRDGLG